MHDTSRRVSRCCDRGELLRALHGSCSTFPSLASTYVQSPTGPCRYSDEQTESALLTWRIVSGSDKCSLPSRPCTISFSPPVIASPTDQGTGSLTLRGASDIERTSPPASPMPSKFCSLHAFPCSWGFFLSEVQIHTHTHSLSLRSSPPWFLLLSRLCTKSTFVNQIVNVF